MMIYNRNHLLALEQADERNGPNDRYMRRYDFKGKFNGGVAYMQPLRIMLVAYGGATSRLSA